MFVTFFVVLQIEKRVFMGFNPNHFWSDKVCDEEIMTNDDNLESNLLNF